MRESKAPIVIPSLLWHNHGGNFLFKVPYHTIGAGMAKKAYLRLKRASRSSEASVDVAIRQSSKYEIVRVSSPLALVWNDPNSFDASLQQSSLSFTQMLTLRENEILLQDVCEIASGVSTLAFQAFITKHEKGSIPHESCCFSVVAKKRTLDFFVSDTETANNWKNALQSLLETANAYYRQPLSRWNNTSASLSTWNPNILLDSAKNGDIQTLRWFFDNGCSTDCECACFDKITTEPNLTPFLSCSFQ